MKIIGWMLAAALVMSVTPVAFAAAAHKGYKGRHAGSYHGLASRNVALPAPYVGPAVPAQGGSGFADSFRYGPFGADRAPITGGGY
jgi:hypothetical protein